MIQSMQFVTITITAGTGGQIQVFQNGVDLGYFRGTKYVVAAIGDNISIWCDADTGYTYTNLCTPDGTCTTARPFNFVANMTISMTATFTATSVTDNGILVNGQPNITVKAGTSIKVDVRMSSGAGMQWRVIAISGSPLGFGDARISTGTAILDANGYGTTNIQLSTPGQYTLVGRWCYEWLSENHCCLVPPCAPVGGDHDTARANVYVEATSRTTTCDPACASDEICLMGQCVSKPIVFIGLALIVYSSMGKN